MVSPYGNHIDEYLSIQTKAKMWIILSYSDPFAKPTDY